MGWKMIFDYYETAGLTRSGKINPNQGCPFIPMCKTNDRCPTTEKNYPHEFSCALSRALAIEYNIEIKEKRKQYEDNKKC